VLRLAITNHKILTMKKNQNYTTPLSVRKFKLSFLLSLFVLATFSFASCNNKGKGDTTTKTDTSSTVTNRVDTVATDSGTKQP